jgi:uncharacterized protein
MLHPDTHVLPTPKGLGVFASRPFRKGEIIWIIDDYDLRIPMAEYMEIQHFQRRKFDRYSYNDETNHVIIPWDDGKLVNHSCLPNATGLIEFDNITVARRDIEAGEEITEDYCSYYGHFETFPCSCGEQECRGRVEPGYNKNLRMQVKNWVHLVKEQGLELLDLEFHSAGRDRLRGMINQAYPC